MKKHKFKIIIAVIMLTVGLKGYINYYSYPVPRMSIVHLPEAEDDLDIFFGVDLKTQPDRNYHQSRGNKGNYTVYTSYRCENYQDLEMNTAERKKYVKEKPKK